MSDLIKQNKTDYDYYRNNHKLIMSVGRDIESFIDGIKETTLGDLSCSICKQPLSCVKSFNKKYFEDKKKLDIDSDEDQRNLTYEDFLKQIFEYFSNTLTDKGLFIDMEEFMEYDKYLSIVKKDGTFIRNYTGRYRFKSELILPYRSKICDSCLDKHEYEPVYDVYCLNCKKGWFSHNCETYNLSFEDYCNDHCAVEIYDKPDILTGIFHSYCGREYDGKNFLITDESLKDHCQKVHDAKKELEDLFFRKRMIKHKLPEINDEELKTLNIHLLERIKEDIHRLSVVIQEQVICNDCILKLLEDKKITKID